MLRPLCVRVKAGRARPGAAATNHGSAPSVRCAACSKRSADAWRTAPAVLLQKKGKDPHAVTSVRHIVLNSVLYKVYAAIIAARLVAYCRRVDACRASQHGFMPQMGTQLHVFHSAACARRVQAAAARRGDRFSGREPTPSGPYHLPPLSADTADAPAAMGSWMWCTTCTRTLACTSRRFRATRDADYLINSSAGAAGLSVVAHHLLIALNPLLRWLELDDLGSLLTRRVPRGAAPSFAATWRCVPGMAERSLKCCAARLSSCSGAEWASARARAALSSCAVACSSTRPSPSAALPCP